MIFLDSDVLSYYFSGDTKIHDKIKETINTGETIALTVMNVYEILKWTKKVTVTMCANCPGFSHCGV